MSISSLLQVIAQEANRIKSLRPQDVFNTTTYVATNGPRTVVNGIDLAGNGGFIWERYREVGQNHSFIDSKRGLTKYILPHSSAAEGTDTNYVQSFNTNGYSLLNDWTAGLNVVSRTFRIAPKFLDIVTYTGTGVVGTSIPHGLEVAPGLMLVKNLSKTADWSVYYGDRNRELPLPNQLAAITTGSWSSSNPSSTEFYLGSSTRSNVTGDSYIAYIFANNPDGVISCGSYTGNGSSVYQDINFGWEPQFALIKSISDSGQWHTFDVAAGLSSGTDRFLSLQSTGAISSLANYINTTSTGMSVTSSLNTSGSSFFYMAIKKDV